MKKVILLSQSLTTKLFKMLCEHVNALTSEDCLCVFQNFDLTCEIGGVKSNYETLKSILKKNGIPINILKEYSLDEYLDNHHGGDIYITPTDSTPVVISSASLLGFKDSIYLLGASKNEPQISNIAPQIRAFKYKDTIGTKGLNKTEVHFDHAKGKSCFYYIDGRRYSQVIKGKGGVLESGVQGYTMVCEDLPEYRIKIWDSFAPKYRYEFDETTLMMANKLAHPSIALPITFVYNENNEPIGFVMKNFNGHELDMHELRKLKNPFKIVEQMLSATLWMETHDLYHRDVNHNMLIDTNGKLAIIDVDSIQYKAFPSTASASDPLNALPRKFSSNSLFYNTIDISYTTMAFIVAAIFDIEDFFGVWDKESGLCSLDQDLLNKLRDEYPSIARLVTKAYVEGRPVAVARQLEVVQKVINGNNSVDNEDEFYRDSYDDFNDDYPNGCDFDYSDDSDCQNYADEDYTHRSIQHNTDVNADDFPQAKGTHNSVNSIDGNEPNKFLYNFVWFFKKLIMSMFSTGTVVQGMTPEKEWQEFVRTRKWAKPLVAASLAVVLMIVMIIAIIIM